MSALRRRFHQLLRRLRLTANRPVRIDSRHIYILPTSYGWLFGILLVLMLVASLNYDNNPAYLLTFLLFGLGSNAMFFTWRNLHGLQVRLQASRPVFAGDPAQLLITPAGEIRPALAFTMQEQATVSDIAQVLDPVVLELPTTRRGWLEPGELTVSTRYPLGLFRAWTLIDIDTPILVYPQPSEAKDLPNILHSTQQGSAREQSGEEDFFGLRSFRPGDPLSRVDWKGLARERELMTKQFSHPAQDKPFVIDWQLFAPRDTETRLSMMTRLVIDAEQAAQVYGLSLPGHTIECGRGERHFHRCLKALAIFGETRP